MGKIEMFIIAATLFVLTVSAHGTIVSESEFNRAQEQIRDLPPGGRIAFWAEQFVGTPYDPDPLGEYVRNRVVVADERVDCMYTTFRVVELSTSSDYVETVSRALDVRFRTRGQLDGHGRVVNYEERYEYGIDMIRSGKFGKDVSGLISKTVEMKGDRGIESVSIIDAESAVDSVEKIRNGDIIFFIKNPSKRVVGEIVGHIGIAVVNGKGAFLVHASGVKNGKGIVKKTELKPYLQNMSFAGIIVTRFD